MPIAARDELGIFSGLLQEMFIPLSIKPKEVVFSLMMVTF